MDDAGADWIFRFEAGLPEASAAEVPVSAIPVAALPALPDFCSEVPPVSEDFAGSSPISEAIARREANGFSIFGVGVFGTSGLKAI